MSEAHGPVGTSAIPELTGPARDGRGSEKRASSGSPAISDDAREIILALENEVDALSRRLESVERAVEAMRALGEDFWRKEAALYLLGLTATSWAYHVRDQNLLFSDLFQLENLPDGTSHRWVGRSGELTASMAINRAATLAFSVETVFFSSPQLAKTLKLEVDGEEIPWLAHDGKRWSAAIPASPSEARLRFRLSVDQSLIPEEKKVSFSIAEIRVDPLMHAGATGTSNSRTEAPTTAPLRSIGDAMHAKAS